MSSTPLDTLDPSEGAVMYVSPMLWVGSGPIEPYLPRPDVLGVRHARTAPEAALLIKQHYAVIVASTDIAYQTLRLIGTDHEWATHATSGLMSGFSPDVFEMSDFSV
jgi:hypothetical protein